MIIAFIFARGGSKGLPDKNIRCLNGKPLIAWSIEHALSIKRIERIIVSTDSDHIAEVARKYGAEVPFKRPTELSGDDSPEWLAWRHALEYIRDTSGSFPDVMLSIPSTAPLRHPIDIDNCLDKFLEGHADIVITISEAKRSPYFNMVKRDPDGSVKLVCSEKKRIVRRQDAPPIYDIATVCYVADPKFVMRNQSIFEGRVEAVHVPSERAVDIDTYLDLKYAEFLMRLQ